MSYLEGKPLIVSVVRNQQLVAVIQKVLTENGYKAFSTTDFVMAMETMPDKNPALVLLDVDIPRMDSFKFCAALRQNETTRNVPFIFLAKDEGDRNEVRAFALGVVDYLSKPFTPEELLDTIKCHLQTSRQWQKFDTSSSPQHIELLSQDFIQFREFLFEQCDLATEQRDRLSKMDISNMYSMLSENGISASTVAQLMARFLNISYVTQVDISNIELGLLPPEFCWSHRVVPVSDGAASRTFVLSNPFDTALMEALESCAASSNRPAMAVSEPNNIEALFGTDSRVYRTMKQMPRVQTKPAMPAQKSKGSILVVEDDPATAKLIARVLKEQGYEVTLAEDGQVAIFLLGQAEFDLVLSDIEMPNVDGLELVKFMAQKRITTPIILLTIRDSASDVREALRMGVRDYILKPFKRGTVLARIDKVMQA